MNRGAGNDGEIGGRTVGVERQHVSWRRRCSVQADRLCEAHYDVVADLIQVEVVFPFTSKTIRPKPG